MRYFRIAWRSILVLLVGLLLHYALPQHDIARINSIEVIRQDFTGFNRLFYAQADSGSAELPTRDLRLINTVRRKTYLFGMIRGSETIMVYRNEDTGWIWPPYFKFDSSDLQAEASNFESSASEPQWLAIRHYGWRNRFFTIYPNATAMWPIEGPDVRIIPWFNIGFFIFMMGAWLFARAMWRQFRERMVDPAMERAGDSWDHVEAGVKERQSRMSRWLGTWRSKK
ncbi:MAG: DUF1523 family protein [Rhodobacteraceae bacterium]|nr:DUF1523 family protein [Paracoccaceae bacterium]